jgi:hypothetical protein
MKNRAIMMGLFVCMSMLAFGSAVWAQDNTGTFYTWKDASGVIHATDSLEKVPKEYRSRAQRVGAGSPDGNTVQEEGTPASSAAGPAPDSSGTNDAALKAQWQSRMLDAKHRLQYAEDKYQQLSVKRNDLKAQWGSSGAALPPQSVLDEMNRLDAEMEATKDEINKARDLIDNVIPDEARRAGVPPGWLRDVE